MGHEAVVMNRGPRASDGQFVSPATQLVGAARMLSLAIEESVETQLHAELAGDRLSRSQWKLLEIFATTPVANVTEVAAYLGVSTAAASKAVDRLARQNLLQRSVDMQDRRHVRLALSAEGASLASAFLQRLHSRLNELWRESSGSELIAFGRVLDRLTASVVRAGKSPSEICLQCELNAREGCLVKDILGQDCLYRSLNRNAQSGEQGQPPRAS